MQIQLNGEKHELKGAPTLAALIASFNLDPRKVAVERNLEIVPKSEYAQTQLAEGDRLEIVAFVGGG